MMIADFRNLVMRERKKIGGGTDMKKNCRECGISVCDVTKQLDVKNLGM